jgi:ParB family chromosome partitioning protein
VTRRGLGRGLDALLANTQPPAESAAGGGEVPRVAVDAIRPNPYQPRRAIDAAELEELVASVRVHGLIQPLIVTRDGDGYCLVAGERRWRAAQAAGLTEVPAIVREVGPRDMLALAIIENVQRTDLGPIEAAQAFRQLMDEFKLTQAEVAELVGKSRAAIANTVRLLNLSAPVRQLVAAGKLSEGHARALLGLEDPDVQLAVARRAIAGDWTVRRAEVEVRERAQPGGSRPGRAAAPAAARPAATDPDTAAAARALEGALGTRVEIRRRGPGGQLILHFYSEEELAALYDRLIGGA